MIYYPQVGWEAVMARWEDVSAHRSPSRESLKKCMFIEDKSGRDLMPSQVTSMAHNAKELTEEDDGSDAR